MQPLLQHKNRVVRVDQTRVLDNAIARTFLSASMSAGAALTVKDIAGFAIGKYVWINPLGANSEIVAVHAATAPTGNTVTLATSTAFAHTTGEEVLYIEFNQIEISHAATVGGSKSVLTTAGMLARETSLRYLDVSQTAGYYFARFKDSVATLYSSYSDAIPNGGWDDGTVGKIIDAALRETENELGKKISIQDCYHWINRGLGEMKGKLRTWPEHAISNYVAGQTVRGINTVTLPTNIYDNETNRSIRALRFGAKGELRYLEPDLYDAQLRDVVVTQSRTEAAVGATTLEIDNSYDFPDSGTATVYVSGVKNTFTYTGVTRSTTAGVLTGIPASGEGSITAIIPVDTNVWVNETEGDPVFYTVRNGAIEYWPLVSSTRDNENIYMDYDAEVTAVNSESDVIDALRFDAIESYLTWRIWCKADNGGILDRNNGFYADYKERMNDAIRTLPNRRVTMSPNLNTMSRRGHFKSRPDVRDLANEDL